MRRGFTLIELLVVIAIIAILASILFPVFAKARGKARQTACLSNVKQIAMAALQYAQDYDESLPSGGDAYGNNGWAQGIYPYAKNAQIFVCPDRRVAADKGTAGTDPALLPGLWPNQFGYGWNVGSVSGGGAFIYDGLITSSWVGISVGYIYDPSVVVMLGDMEPNTGAAGTQMMIAYYTDGSGTSLADRHNGGGNYAFCDGHAKWFAKSKARGSREMFSVEDPSP